MSMPLKAIATVANGQTVSSWVRLDGLRVVGIVLPAVITSTSAQFECAFDDGFGERLTPGTALDVVSTAGTDMSITFVASDYVVIDDSALSGAPFLRLVMGSAEGAAREIGVVLADRA